MLDVLIGELADDGPGVRTQDDQALGLERLQCVTHRNATRTAFRREVPFDQPASRRALAVEDRVPQPRGDAFGFTLSHASLPSLVRRGVDGGDDLRVSAARGELPRRRA